MEKNSDNPKSQIRNPQSAIRNQVPIASFQNGDSSLKRSMTGGNFSRITSISSSVL